MIQTDAHSGDALIPPSSLLVFWPGDTPPMAEEVRLRLVDWGRAVPVEESGLPEETLWGFWFELGDRPTTYLIWCEPLEEAQELWRRYQPDSNSSSEETVSCRWAIGIEGPVSLRQPSVDYQLQLRLCDAISRDWSPAIFDASALKFHLPSDLQRVVETKTPPCAAALYSVHEVPTTRGPSEKQRYWMHTHGLERTGIPDLEIFDVPGRLCSAARELVHTVADLWIGGSTPEPLEPFTIGEGLEISWRPWQAVAAELSSRQPGGWAYRNRACGHSGFRAVLAAHSRPGWARRHWRSPLDVLQKLANGKTALYRTQAETDRAGQLAKERFGNFGMIFVSEHPSKWKFAVKLCYPSADANGAEEHLWFEVLQLKPGRIRGKLLNEPLATAGLPFSATDWHEFDRLSDWRILTPTGTFNPENAGALLESPSSAH